MLRGLRIKDLRFQPRYSMLPPPLCSHRPHLNIHGGKSASQEGSGGGKREGGREGGRERGMCS